MTWEGGSAHHAEQTAHLAAPTLRDGGSTVLDHGEVECPDPECSVRAAVIAPIVSEGRLVGALAAYGQGTPAGIVVWLEHCADALVAAADEGHAIADAVLAGRLR